MKQYASCAGASKIQCRCYIDYDGKTGINSIEQCSLCKAAPELLVACKAVTKNLECLRLGDRNMPPCKKGWQCYVCEAQAAITKAEKK